MDRGTSVQSGRQSDSWATALMSRRAVDVLLASLLFVAVFAFLRLLWPNILIALDEGAFLYEAKLILDGKLMYRDFFDLTGPAAQHAIALMFAVFGVSMDTARGSMAILHAIIAALMYALARRLGVRPLLAATVCLVQIVLCYPAYPFATPHWFSTVLTLLIFFLLLREPATRPRDAVLAGVLTAVVCLTQQPKGASTAAAVAIVLLRDAWAARRTSPLGTLVARQFGSYVAATVAVLVLVLGALVISAGFEPVFDALVRQPLGPYRAQPFVRDASWLPIPQNMAALWLLVTTWQVFFLTAGPLIIVVSAARVIWRAARGMPVAERRQLFVAVVFSAFSIVSVLYQPNYNHFAIVAPIWLSLFAESLEQLSRRGEARGIRLAAPLMAAAILAVLAIETRRVVIHAWAEGVDRDTAFGRVHFLTEAQADEVVALRAALTNADATSVFVYPYGAGLYMMTETANPTRFQLLIPAYNTPEQYSEVEHVLERERVPFVIRTLWWWGEDGDPLMPYLRAHYRRVALPAASGVIPSLSLFRRKADGAERNAADTAIGRRAGASVD